MTSSGLGDAGLVALLAIVPLIILMLTSFVKISVVLSLSRNAIGATEAPSGLVVMGMSLILTFFVMAPVAVEMVQAAATVPTPGGAAPAHGAPVPGIAPATRTAAPASLAPAPASASGMASVLVPLDLDTALRAIVPAEHQRELAAIERALVPLRGFLLRHAAARDRATFVELAARMGHAPSGDEIWVLAPAFLTTELKEAFAIAVLIFIPFLVLDLIVGLGLASLGLQSTSPQVVALPLKLLLFVSVDGWRLLIESLLRGYV